MFLEFYMLQMSLLGEKEDEEEEEEKTQCGWEDLCYVWV